MRRGLLILATTSAFAVPVDASAAVTFDQLWFAGVDATTLPRIDVSADGGVVVGPGVLPGLPNLHALRWTATDGRVEPLFETNPVQWVVTGAAVSSDGSVVVGAGLGAAYRWTAQTGAVPVATDIASLNPNDVSEDGMVVVGDGVRGPSRPFGHLPLDGSDGISPSHRGR